MWPRPGAMPIGAASELELGAAAGTVPIGRVGAAKI